MGDHDPALLDKGEEESEVDRHGGELVEDHTGLPVREEEV